MGILNKNLYGISYEEYQRYLGKVNESVVSPVIYSSSNKQKILTLEELHNKYHFIYIQTPIYKKWRHLKEILFQSQLYNLDSILRKNLKPFKGVNAKAAFYIQYIDDKIGYGLCTIENIPENSCIGEYVGVIRPKHFWNQRSDYLFKYPTAELEWVTDMQVDAKYYGNHTRFINHSTQPNLDIQLSVVSSTVRIFFITKRLINSGEQLTYFYGNSYWKKKKKVPEII